MPLSRVVTSGAENVGRPDVVTGSSLLQADIPSVATATSAIFEILCMNRALEPSVAVFVLKLFIIMSTKANGGNKCLLVP